MASSSSPCIASSASWLERYPELLEDKTCCCMFPTCLGMPRSISACPSKLDFCNVGSLHVCYCWDDGLFGEWVQEQWDEEKDPEGFRLGGTAPKGRADAPVAAAAAGGSLSLHQRLLAIG